MFFENDLAHHPRTKPQMDREKRFGGGRTFAGGGGGGAAAAAAGGGGGMGGQGIVFDKGFGQHILKNPLVVQGNHTEKSLLISPCNELDVTIQQPHSNGL